LVLDVTESKRVRIMLSDPWDFGESREWRPLWGRLLSTSSMDGGTALVRLEPAVEYKGNRYLYLVASARHEGCHIEDLDRGGAVTCGMACFTEEHVSLEVPIAKQWSRTTLGCIGTVELKN
jgi:hypothetical protein